MNIDLGKLLSANKPLVMGIINCTPDSFFEGSRRGAVEDALETALQMEADGADILDIGGESSRPGSSYVSAEEEMERIIPVIEAIRRESAIPVSVDTRKASVAKAAMAAGGDIINDISALGDDPGLAPFAAEAGVPVILMHMKGNPENMQDDPFYENVMTSVLNELLAAADRAVAAGIRKENIILDPGIGFGKRQQDNLDLLKGIGDFSAAGYPVLIGLSRKRFIGNITGRDAWDRMAGTIAANLFSAIKGADILRVHDVRETVDALKVLKALL